MKDNRIRPENTQRSIKKITIIGLIGNLFLTIIKLFLGVIGNSQAVVADAFHSLSDMATDIAVIIGVKYWDPPADEAHPYGHRKIETVITLIIGIILAFVGMELAINAIRTLPEAHNSGASLIAALGPLISLILKESLYHWTIHVGNRTKSSALLANAWHHRSDAISSIPALIAVIIASFYPEYAFIDHIGAVVVSILIFKVAWDISKPAFVILIDSGANKKEIEEIKKIVLLNTNVVSVHGVRTRKVADNYFVDLHVLVDGSLSVTEGHNISEDVKQNLLKLGPNIIDVIIHLEPHTELEEN